MPQQGTSDEDRQLMISWRNKKNNFLDTLPTWSYVLKQKQGPVVQSIVSLTSSLVVKMLTALVSTVSDCQLFLLKKMSHFFSKNIKAYAIFNDQSFNDTLTNDIVSFEQLGPDY